MSSAITFPPRLSRVDREFFVGVARAFAGALIFSLPILMTMETWWLGFYMSPSRLALLLLLTLPLLVGLSRFGGFKPTTSLRDDVVDAFVAILVAAIAASIVLYVLGILTMQMPAREIVGKIALQTVPGSIGAMLARSQLAERPRETDDRDEERKEHPSYAGALFLMTVGALFLSFNIAPTEEMLLIPYKMTVWHEVGLVVLSLLLMHGFVYSVSFRGSPQRPQDATSLSLFAHFTVVGYGIALLVSCYVLWTFGRTDGLALEEVISASVVLGFPASIGAAAARLIL